MPKDYFHHLSDGKSPPTYKNLFNGKWVESTSGKKLEVKSPIDDSIVGYVYSSSFGEIDEAIKVGHEAQKLWREVPMIKRSKILHLAADWIREHEHYLTTLLIKEIGKNLAEAKDEILRSADMIDYFANAALNIKGEELSGEAFPGYDQTKMGIIEKVPLGVVVAIAPFNYPVNLSVAKLAPAIVMGNSVVFKPPTMGSISGLHLAEVFRIAGVPDGVLNTVTGEGADVGNYLVTHPGVDMVTFTGSSQVGREITTKIGMIPLLFECGGNNPAIVLPDCDMESTATEIVKGAFSYSGQRCTAIKYVLGLEPTLDKLIPLVVKKTKEMMKMGDPRIPTNNLGPVISEAAAMEIEKRIIMAKVGGAKILLGGKREGSYIEATILDRVKPEMDIVRIETFGPVVSFFRMKSMEEIVSLINKSSYGLQASIFTKDEGAGIALAKKLDVGTVQINSKPQRGPDHFPFLGTKGSGLGVQGIKYTLEAMVRPRPIVLNKPH
ncbi:aldehyde dehydrogenase family protein [Candidatus Gottesmanbacteria bacterium]|nr:aldehyde dehydrogenase family protein [Candidatus Gottesmanbacteria bacterium]